MRGALYKPMHSTRDIRHEQWRLCVIAAERDSMFVEIEVKADAATTWAIADGNVANVSNSASFAWSVHVYRRPHLDR